MELRNITLPTLRFPEFDEAWKRNEFGNIAERSSAKYNPEKASENYPCIELESLSQETGVLLQTFVANDLKSIKNKFEKGEILFGKLRPYLKKFLKAPFDGVCTSEIWVLRGTEISNDFLYYVIQSEKFNYASNVSSGSKMPRADWDYVSAALFSYPGKEEEQQKIAAFLSSVDKKIGQLSRKKEVLIQYKKGVMQRIFDQKIRFKDDNGNNFANWNQKEFGEVFTFRVTNSFSRDDLNYSAGGVKNIHYGDIHTKFKALFDISKEEVPYINPEISLKRIAEDNYCKPGDLIIADASEDYADVGKCIEIINLNGEKVLAGLHTLLARPDLQEMETGFSGYMMQSRKVRLQIMTIAQGTKVLSISGGRLANIEVKLPSPPEQRKIADFLAAIDSKIDLVNIQLEKTKTFKKGLLQRMFV